MAAQVLHFGIEQHPQPFHLDAKPHNRIAVNACKPLNRADARAFRQGTDDRDLLVYWSMFAMSITVLR